MGNCFDDYCNLQTGRCTRTADAGYDGIEGLGGLQCMRVISRDTSFATEPSAGCERR
jgi:hypothetical protein